MSSTLSPSSYVSFGLSHAAVHRDDPLPSPAPFFVRPTCKGVRGVAPVLPAPFGLYERPFEPVLVQRRNERERQRVRCVNQGYTKLRNHLPGQNRAKRLSKVETLRAAIRYIKFLQDLMDPTSTPPGTDVGRPPQDASSGPESETCQDLRCPSGSP